MILQGFRHQAGRSLSNFGNAIPKKITTHRFIHLAPVGKCVPIRTTFTRDLYNRQNNFLVTAIAVRHNSTAVETELLPSIPDIPVPVPDIAKAVIEYHANGDPTFSSIGLGGYGPIGGLQYLIEALHVHAHLPWWGSIAAASVILKLAVLNFYIKGQRLQVITHNHSPTMQSMQRRMMEEQASGNLMEASVLMHEQRQYIKEHGLSPFKPLLNSLIQGGVSLSTFFAIRGILASDLESLRFGGYWWFPDLTQADPNYFLPVATVLSIAVLTETMMASNVFQAGIMKYVLRAVPLISFPIMIQFGAGLQVFWLTTNIITLLQMVIIKLPVMQKLLKMPEKREIKPSELNLMQNVKKWQEKSTLKKQAASKYTDHILLASRQPFVKTFKYNPKAQPSTADMQKMKMK